MTQSTAKALGHYSQVPVKKTEDEIMADVRGSAPPGNVLNRPQDTLSSTGAQICRVGNMMMV